MTKNRYNYRTILAVILIMPLFTILMVEVAIIPFVKKQMMVQKEQAIRQVVEVAYGIIENNEKQIKIDRISLAEAQERAKRTLKEIRYSSKDYFWINDMGQPEPKMIMHPTEPFLDGTLLDDPEFNRATRLRYGLNGPEKNLNNLNLFVAFTEVAEKAGHGYVTYYWAKPTLAGGITKELYQKLSYVKLFNPWGWVIGSGIYVDDVYNEAATLRYWVYSATLILTTFLLIISYWLNLAKRKQVEQALLETRELFTLLMHSSPIYIFIKEVTPNGSRVLQASENYQQMIGIPGSEMVGKTMEELFPTDFAAKMTADDLAVVSKGEVLQFDESFNGRSYTTIRFPMVLGDKSLLAGYTIDITERKQAEEEIIRLNAELEERVAARTIDLEKKRTELEESQEALMIILDDLNQKSEELKMVNTQLKELDRLKSMFIASMSHELRTPLNSIIGFSSILHDEWVGPVNAEQKENLAIVHRCGTYLLSLINDVIDVSRIEAGKIESIFEEFDLHDLIDEAISLVKKEMEEKGLELRVAAPHQQMHTDRRRLLQCLLNLLSNAVKFTEKGSITVEVQLVRAPGKALAGSVVEITVADTGIGIRAEDQPKIFQPFVRLVSPLQANIPGTGLGLYLTLKLANEILHGEILLTSEYGQGSRFTIKIPVRMS